MAVSSFAAIEDHAIVGDCRTAALLTRDGVCDWLCWPRPDSPSMFGALLDPKAGSFVVRARGATRTTRAYVEGTNVLQTRFFCPGGELLLTDLFPVLTEAQKREVLVPDHELLRVAECTRGEVVLEVLYDPRPGYGQIAPRLRDLGKLGLRLELRQGLVTLRSSVPLSPLPSGGFGGEVVLRAGELRDLSLTLAAEAPAVLPPLGERSREAIARSVAFWRAWSAKTRYDGPFRAEVVRSALLLKLLCYAPSGAVLAAPTTSLPERVGGTLNWDYRFCWLRDASLTARALFGLGHEDEADAFVSWMLHSTRTRLHELRVLYDVYGVSPQAERELPLAGYRGSRPVRVGNAAENQLQLDVYGEAIDATAHFVRAGGRLDGDTREMLRQFGHYVLAHWDAPDEGIWEARERRVPHTHSRVLCWAALDRLLELHGKGHLRKMPVDRVRKRRDELRAIIEERSWNEGLGSYTQTAGGDTVDAALLLMPWYGYLDAASPRMRSTFKCIDERLNAGRGMLYRYEASRRVHEGAFGICSFWAAECLALGAGTYEEAEARVRTLLGTANDVGLFAEEVDPSTSAALGNFPQAFTHVGLINAALSLQARAEGRRKVQPEIDREAGAAREGSAVAGGASP